MTTTRYLEFPEGWAAYDRSMAGLCIYCGDKATDGCSCRRCPDCGEVWVSGQGDNWDVDGMGKATCPECEAA